MRLNYLGFFFLCFIAISGKLHAQEKLLSIEDCYNPKYFPAGLRALQWIPGKYKFSQLKNDQILSTDPYSLKTDTLFSLAQINRALRAEKVELKSLPAFHWKDENVVWFLYNNNIYDYNLREDLASLRREIGDNEVMEICESNLHVGMVQNNNLWVSTAGGKTQVTTDGAPGIVYGQAVHRNEFGIEKGMFWSHDGYQLAFYRMDERRVTEAPLMDIKSKPSSTTKYRYPMAGDSSHTVTLGIYNTVDNSTLYLKTDGPYDQYLTNIAWSPDDRYIYIAWVNREQNRMQMRRYSASTGELVSIEFEELSDKYVEPEHPPIFLPDGNGYLWLSERDGYNHLYWYKNSKTPIQVTRGNWAVTDFIGFDASGETIYIESTQQSALERQVYSIKLTSKDFKLKKITVGKGVHKVLLNNHSGLYMDIFSNTLEPRKYSVYKSDGTFVNDIYKAENPLLDFKLGKLEIKPFLVGDNIALYTRTFFPPDFDKQKKYPVIVYVYGGPHAQMITESWLGGANLWFHYMAQNGYIVYTIDNRGSSNRGLAFESSTFRRLGTLESEDQLAGLGELMKYPFVDTSRMGVHGWSFGGFMTTRMMTRYPNIFKVGVAGGPVIDWSMYEIMYTERYMDRPQDNPDGYANANLLNSASRLSGKLLMIHGMDDDVVMWQQSLLYAEKMVKLMNVNLDYYVYPGHKHNVLGPDRAHLYKKISQYFFDYL